jgi:hypothetical protein
MQRNVVVRFLEDICRTRWVRDSGMRSWVHSSSQPWKNEPTMGAAWPPDQLAAALNELTAHLDDDSLTNWTGDSSRTHDDVINTLDAAAMSAAEMFAEWR